jgi:mannosyltransferase OCH1-like enzyme
VIPRVLWQTNFTDRLQEKGGVYLDFDGHLVWPLGFIVKPEYPELYVITKRGDISNDVIARKKEDIHLERMVEVILKNIE